MSASTTAEDLPGSGSTLLAATPHAAPALIIDVGTAPADPGVQKLRLYAHQARAGHPQLRDYRQEAVLQPPSVHRRGGRHGRGGRGRRDRIGGALRGDPGGPSSEASEHPEEPTEHDREAQ